MSQFSCSGESAAHDAGAGDLCQCADCRLMFPGGELRAYPHGNVCKDCHDDRQDSSATRAAIQRSPRKAAGAFRTFCHFRQSGMTTAEAHACVRRWSYEVRSQFAPNPLCMSTRKDLTAYYNRPGAYTGD